MSSRVAHLITSLNRGGAERMLVRLLTDADRARDIEHTVIALMPSGAMTDDVRAAGIDVYELGMKRGRPSVAAFVRLVLILRRVRPTLLMTWLYHNDLLGTFARRLVRSPRLVWNIRGSAGLTAGRSWSTRLVIRLLARLSHLPEAVGSNSHRAIETHRALGYRPLKWLYLPNGFPTSEWYPDPDQRLQVRRELGFEEHQRVVVSVARTDPEKDPNNLLQAADAFLRQDQDARLLLIGRGTDELTMPVDTANKVVALGERRDVSRLLRGCDVAILSSATEGFPNAVGEAMASGLPVVATDVGDTARIIADTGRVVPPRDPQALAVATLELLRLDRNSLAQLARLARKRIIAHYSLDSAREAYGRVWRGEET